MSSGADMMELSGAVSVEMPVESQSAAIAAFEFDVDTMAMPVLWSMTALAGTLVALWIVSTLGRRLGLSGAKQMGLNRDGVATVGNYVFFLYQGIYVSALFVWAWSSAKAVLGHTAASHLFGGLAIGVGLALRDLFSAGMTYFTLKTSSPFECNDLLYVRTGNKQVFLGYVRRIDFLHTKLDAVDTAAREHDDELSGAQYVQNAQLMQNAIVVFKHRRHGKFVDAWAAYQRWKRSQVVEEAMGVAPPPIAIVQETPFKTFAQVGPTRRQAAGLKF